MRPTRARSDRAPCARAARSDRHSASGRSVSQMKRHARRSGAYDQSAVQLRPRARRTPGATAAAVTRRRAARRRRRPRPRRARAGTSATRAPDRRARTPRSRPSSAPASAGSSPPSSRQASLRTRMPRTSAPSTSSTAVVLALVEFAVGESDRAAEAGSSLTPSDTISERSSQRTSLGATNATEGDSSSAPARRLERLGLGRGVLREQPDRVAVDAAESPMREWPRRSRSTRAP